MKDECRQTNVSYAYIRGFKNVSNFFFLFFQYYTEVQKEKELWARHVTAERILHMKNIRRSCCSRVIRETSPIGL